MKNEKAGKLYMYNVAGFSYTFTRAEAEGCVDLGVMLFARSLANMGSNCWQKETKFTPWEGSTVNL